MTRLGIFQPDAPGDMRDLHAVERHIGRRVDLVNWFTKFDKPYRDDHVQAVIDHGATPMLTWEPWGVSLRDALNGAADATIRHFGAMIQKHGHNRQLHVRLAHEANGDWYPWRAGDNPGLYRDFWRRTRLIVRNRAPGTRFVFCVNRSYPGSTPLRDMWPGADAVDCVAIDAYDNPKFTARHRSPAELFRETLREIRQLWTGPMMIAETGSVPGQHRTGWLRDLIAWCRNNNIDALTYFNAKGSGDYRLSPNELAVLGEVA